MSLVTTLLLALGAHASPLPHDPGLSSVRVVREDGALVVHAAFANADFCGAVAVDADRDGEIDAAELAAAAAAVERAATSGFVLRTPAGAFAPLAVTSALAENDDVELTLRFHGAASECTMSLGFLERLSRGHRCYATVVDSAEQIVADALLSPTEARFAVPAAAEPAAGFGQAARFFVLGVEHILLGFDHLAFLLALLAAGVTLGRAIATITAFTLAHSVTLVAAAIGVVGLPSLLVEATIAASIVWVAACNLLRRGDGAPHRWPLALAFGLVHGFGFAGVLADLDIGGPGALAPLLTFNLGVEVGQLAFALVVVPLLWRFARHRRARSAVSIAVGAAGLLWFLERVLA